MLALRVKPSRSDAPQGNRKRGIGPKTEFSRQDPVDDFELDGKTNRRGKEPGRSLDQVQICKSERVDGRRFSAVCGSD
jgi:hypothetical protein